MIKVDTVNHPAAWLPASLNTDDWVVCFSPQECQQIVEVARELAALDCPTDKIADNIFRDRPGSLHKTLEVVSRDVVNGRGFILLRNFPIDELNEREAAYGYAAIGRYFGRLQAQNPKGDVLGKVTNLDKDWKSDPTARGYQTNMHMDFHSDSCDCVALLCVNPAKSGGLSAIVSSVSIYNHMREHTPELLETLCQDFTYDRRGEEKNGVLPYYKTALFHEHNGEVFNRYCREYIESAQRFPDVARLTPEQIAAIDEFDRLCHSDQFILHMDFRRGDIQFLNNHVILHSRTAFEDYQEQSKRRLLWRLYVSNREAAERPSCYESRFSDPERWALSAING